MQVFLTADCFFGWGYATELRLNSKEEFRVQQEVMMKEKVMEALNAIRPYLQMDGGDVELVDIVDGIVKVRLRGACSGCPGASMTLKMGVERVLREKVPEIKGIEAVA
jgi:Fe-S cluster biogenesis protein NfuA